MARRTPYQRVETVARFLTSLRRPGIADALRAHGFSDDDLREGVSLLLDCFPATLPPKRSPRRPTTGAEDVARWRRRWVAIARASLGHRAPDAAAWLLGGIDRASTVDETIGAVLRFVERVEALDRAPGIDGARARALLAARGLGEEVLAEGRALAEAALGRVEEESSGDANEEDDARYGDAVNAAWRWYLEWGAIARVEGRTEIGGDELSQGTPG